MKEFEKLKEIIAEYESAVIAFSGGVDSTFLAKAASEILGDKLLLITATSSTYPFFELDESKELARQLEIPQQVIVSEEIDIPGFSQNPPDRCYYCKKELFTLINHIAAEKGYAVVFDGSNADDVHDYRPGMKALRELSIVSPLRLAGMGKEHIRKVSREMGLATADKPSFACLASRFPYGVEITKEKLDRVGTAEQELRALGFTQLRVRDHDGLARIEFAADEMDRAWDRRDAIRKICDDAGFTYISIDLQGYRTGAMNEALAEGEKADM